MSARPAEQVDTANIGGHFINGEVVADDNRPVPVTNPATGQVSRHVAMASQKTVEDAIAAAQAGLHVAHRHAPEKRGERRREGGDGVRLHQ